MASRANFMRPNTVTNSSGELAWKTCPPYTRPLRAFHSRFSIGAGTIPIWRANRANYRKILDRTRALFLGPKERTNAHTCVESCYCSLNDPRCALFLSASLVLFLPFPQFFEPHIDVHDFLYVIAEPGRISVSVYINITVIYLERPDHLIQLVNLSVHDSQISNDTHFSKRQFFIRRKRVDRLDRHSPSIALSQKRL